jgi:hypothetical protein
LEDSRPYHLDEAGEVIEDRKLTVKEERKWPAEFKTLGREAVRVRSPAFQPQIKRDLAIRWLREQELAAERRERGTFWIAVAVLVLTVVGIALTLAGY